MEFEALRRPLDIVRQDTVIDIQPTSRLTPGGPDTAIALSTLVLADAAEGSLPLVVPSAPGAQVSARAPGVPPVSSQRIGGKDRAFGELTDLLRQDLSRRKSDDVHVNEHLERVEEFHVMNLELNERTQLVQLVSVLPVPEFQEGYRFSGMAPIEFAALKKGGEFTLLALLPASSEEDSDLPSFRVRLAEWSGRSNAVVYGQGGIPPLGGRTAVSWHDRADPDHFLFYVYDLF